MLKKCVCLLLCLPVCAQNGEGWRTLVDANDFEKARSFFANGLGDDSLAEIGWFLTFTGAGPTAELENAALTILRRNPESPASEFVMKWMTPYRECLSSWVEQAAAAVAGHNPDNPELKVLYAANARLHARYRDTRPDFVAIARKAGFVTDWKITPRYGFNAVADFAKDWPPEKVSGWTDAVDHTSPSGVVLPPREATGAGLYYAYGSFENPVEQEIQLRLFSYQNIAVYIDGKLWHKVRHLQELGSSISYIRSKLPPGRHDVVVKVSQLRGNNGQFSVQVTAPQAPILLKPEQPKLDLTAQMAQVEEVKTGLMAELDGRPGELAELVRGVLHRRDKDAQRTLAIFDRLAQKHPSSLLVGGLSAQIYLDMVPFLPPQEQLSRAYQLLGELARTDSPYNTENRLALALLLRRAQQTKPALELINAVVEANPGFCDALTIRMGMAAADSLHDVQANTLELVEQLGTNNHFGQTTLLANARRDDDLARTRSLLENLSRLLPWDGYIAQINNMDENYEAAIEDFSKRWELFPDRDYYPYAIAKAYANLGQQANQREWLEKTLDTNPGHREAILDLVNLDCYEGKRDDARGRLNAYLQVEPGDAFFRQRLSHLEGATPFETFRVAAEEVIEAAKNKPISEGADSELLLDQLMVRIFPDGSQIRYTHLVTRVLTKKGVDDESEKRLVGELDILNMRTIKQDGSVFYPESFEEKASISLAGVGVGDFIDEEHIEYLAPAYYDHNGLDAEMTFIFQGVDRIYHHSELVLIYPEDLDPEPTLFERHMPHGPQREQKDGLKYIRWLVKDNPPLASEPNMVNRAHIQPSVTFYYNTDWAEVRDFYYSNMEIRMGLTDRLKQRVAAWREKTADPVERAKAIYREIADRTEPGDSLFANVNLVWETAKGNPTLLLTAIYRELGHECDIVYVQSREAEEFMFDVPMPSHAYTLLRLKIGDQTFWLDPNQQRLEFGYIPYPFRGIRGLVCDPTKPLFDQVPGLEDELERVETHYSLYFAANGSLEGIGSEKFFGMFASQMSKSFEALNNPEIKQRVEAGLNQTYPGAAMSRVDITEDLPPGNFELTHDFSHSDLAKSDGSSLELSFPLPKTPLIERFGSMPKRTTPIRVASPHFNVASIEMVAPKGFHWINEEMAIKEETRFGRYELSISLDEERKLLLKRTYYLKSGMVTPEDYPQFLAFCRAMVDHEDISFKAEKDGGSP